MSYKCFSQYIRSIVYFNIMGIHFFIVHVLYSFSFLNGTLKNSFVKCFMIKWIVY